MPNKKTRNRITLNFQHDKQRQRVRKAVRIVSRKAGFPVDEATVARDLLMERVDQLIAAESDPLVTKS